MPPLSDLYQTRSRTQAFHPRLETLENRCCPSTVAVHGSTLLIQGDNQANAVSIADDGQGGITATVDGQSATGSGITNVVMILRNGNDTVSYTASGILQSPLHLVIQGGRGEDQVTLDFSAGVSAPRLKIDLFGGDGNDQVTAKFGDITDTHLFINGHLGKGDDTFDATLSGNLLGTAQARFNVFGEMGKDTIGVHAAATNIDAGALLALRLNGGKDDDTITVDYEGTLNGALRIVADGLQDKDTITANLTADAGSTGSLNAAVLGKQDDDALTLNVTDNSGGGGASTLAALNAVLDGGQGTDTCTATSNVVVKNCP
jgi:hypothetical protein